MSTTVTISVASGGYDGSVYATGTTYPPSTPYVDTNALIAYRSYIDNTHTLYVGMIIFDTSSIPDDANIISAKLRIKCTGRNDVNSRNLCADWRNVDSITTSDYTSTAGTNAISGVPISSIYLNYNEFDLINLSNINKSGKTGIRLHISGGIPNGDNSLFFDQYESGRGPQLIITYESGWQGKMYGVTPKKIFGIEPKKVMGI